MRNTSRDRYAPVWVSVLLMIIGVALVVVAIVYFTESAGKLPSYFPGHQAGSAHKHSKHGLLALVLGLIAFAGAWMSGGSSRRTAA